MCSLVCSGFLKRLYMPWHLHSWHFKTSSPSWTETYGRLPWQFKNLFMLSVRGLKSMGKKRGSVIYSTHRKNEANKMFSLFYSIPKPPNSSSCLSLTSFTDLLRLRSSGLPLLSSSVWFSATVLGEMLCILTHWLLGEMLRSPQYFSCSLYFYSTSNCFPPTKWLLLPWS